MEQETKRFRIGDRVHFVHDGYAYPGKVIAVDDDGTYHCQVDDIYRLEFKKAYGRTAVACNSRAVF